MTKRTKMIIGAAALLCLGLFLLFGGGNWFGKPEVTVPVMELSNSEMQETQGGKVIWKLKAERVSIGADKNSATMENVEGYFKNEDTEFTLKAKTGRVLRKEQWVYLEGEVRGKTKDGAEQLQATKFAK